MQLASLAEGRREGGGEMRKNEEGKMRNKEANSKLLDTDRNLGYPSKMKATLFLVSTDMELL